MIVNVFFSEEDLADIIFLPNKLDDIDSLQTEFLEWLFDKENDHEYWVIWNGKKMYCKYGTDAFIKWINENKLSDFSEKAKVIKRNCDGFCRENKKVNF